MKLSFSKLIVVLIAGFFAAQAPALLAQSARGNSASPAENQTDKGWPRVFAEGPISYAVYQPEIEQWRGNQIDARAAVAITDGQKRTAYGVLWFSARTEIDKINRLVSMSDFRVAKVSFPAAPERSAQFQSLMQQRMPKAAQVIALDRLLADLTSVASEHESAGYQLKNDPPRIFFSTRPAILVLIDGTPVLRPETNTKFQRVINTRVLILKDDSSARFYLHLMDGWMESNTATGPWTVSHQTPGGLTNALKIAADSKQVDLLDGSHAGSSTRRPSLKEAAGTNSVPEIYASTEPAELLQTSGDPQIASIEGTQLIYVTNTENDIFIETSTQNHYVLISGRWFRSQSMNGPWQYVPGRYLPSDFAAIPQSHPKADVLASIPGTPQAKEALIANSIPQTTTVTRATASLSISFDGDPKFKPIESTSMQYAINSSTPVIVVNANSYYAIQNGVWFVAFSATGSWTVATSVPAVIYTIPPSSSLHYVTYVKVYGSTPEVVYVGYTPGYYGTVASSGVVVYGTGWYYPPYIGSYWYGWGWTYGYAAGFAWSAYAGWSVAFGIGYGWSSYYYPGAWYAAGYYGNGWAVAPAANGYGQWGSVAYSGTRAAWANSYTGNIGQAAVYSGVNTVTGTRYNGRAFTNTNVYTGTTVSGAGGVAYNPNTGKVAAGQAGAVSNAYTGNAAAGARGVNYNPNTGVISGGAVGGAYNASTGQIAAGGRGFAYNTKTDTGVAVGKNNVYAGKDGNVYRYNKSEGLQRHTNDGWSSVSRPDSEHFQNQQSARAAGQQRWESFRSGGTANVNAGGRSIGNGGFTGGRGSGGSARFSGRRR